MAIIRYPIANDNTANYIATLALFCGISCTILMLRFGGFKVNFNLSSGKRVKSEYYEDVPVLATTVGAYRPNREEFYGNGSFADPPRKLHPSMVTLPPSKSQSTLEGKTTNKGTKPEGPPTNIPPPPPLSNIPPPPQPAVIKPPTNNNLPQGNIRPPNLPPNLQPAKPVTLTPSKSTNNLSQGPSNIQSNLAKSTPTLSMNPNGEQSDNILLSKKEQDKLKKQAAQQEKERQKLEKKRIADEKKREKLAALEQAKLEKERKAREKQEAQRQAKEAKLKKSKEKTKKPEAKPSLNPLARGANDAQPQPQGQGISQAPQGSQPPQYSTNTLESSISRTSGPPAYDANPVHNQNDNTGNTSFGKPVEEMSTWDMVSQHRQQMSRPKVAGAGTKQTVLDLEYSTAGRKSIYI